MFVIMKSKFMDLQRSGFSAEAASDSDAHSESPYDSLANLKTDDSRRSKRETRCLSARARGGTTYKTKHTILPKVLLNENYAQTDFDHSWSSYIPQETMFRVQSEPRNRTGQSLSQSFLKAKFAAKPLVAIEDERNGIDVRNYIFSNELCSSHSASHFKKESNGSGSLVKVRYNLENHCPLSQNTVNNRGTRTTILNEKLKDMFLNSKVSDTLPLSFPNCQVFCGLTPGASESIRVQVSDLSMNNRSHLSMNESYGTVNSWQNATEAPIQHERYPKNSTQTSYSDSEMSLEEPLEENLDERATYQGTSESGFGSQHFTTASEPRSKSPPRAFNPRSESCSSPVPDYSP